MDKIWKYSLLIATLIIVDQMTKGAVQSNFYYGETINIIEGFFNLTYVRNPGAAFGLGAGAPIYLRKFFFQLLPVIACCWLAWLIWTHRTKVLSALTFSFILAGAVGNLIDRFTLGYVVDFFDFFLGAKHFPAFNIADSCITIGAVLLIIDSLLQWKGERQKAS